MTRDDPGLIDLVEALGYVTELPGIREASAVVELPTGLVTVQVMANGVMHVRPTGEDPIVGHRPEEQS